MQRFTRQLPREVTMQEIQECQPPYAFGATHAYSAFFCLAEVRCATYVIIIRMHQVDEQLQRFVDGDQSLGAAMYVGEEKKMKVAQETTAIAEHIFIELSKPECFLGAKDGLCVITGVSAFFFPSLIFRLTTITRFFLVPMGYRRWGLYRADSQTWRNPANRSDGNRTSALLEQPPQTRCCPQPPRSSFSNSTSPGAESQFNDQRDHWKSLAGCRLWSLPSPTSLEKCIHPWVLDHNRNCVV